MSPCQCNEGPAASAAAFKPHRHDPHRAGATRHSGSRCTGRNRLADASQTRDALKASDGKWPSRSVLTEPPATQEKKTTLAAVPQLFSVHRALGGPSPLPPGCSAPPNSFRFIGALGGTFSATPEKTGPPIALLAGPPHSRNGFARAALAAAASHHEAGGAPRSFPRYSLACHSSRRTN